MESPQTTFQSLPSPWDPRRPWEPACTSPCAPGRAGRMNSWVLKPERASFSWQLSQDRYTRAGINPSSRTRVAPRLTSAETEVQPRGGTDSPWARPLHPPDALQAPHLDSARSAGGVAPRQCHSVPSGSVRRPGRGAHAGCSRAAGHSGRVFSAPAAEGSARCALGQAFSSGCGRGRCPAPARSRCPLPLDPVPPSLLSTWVAAAQPSGGLWDSHGPGRRPRRLPIPVWELLVPAHL